MQRERESEQDRESCRARDVVRARASTSCREGGVERERERESFTNSIAYSHHCLCCHLNGNNGAASTSLISGSTLIQLHSVAQRPASLLKSDNIAKKIIQFMHELIKV